MKFCEKCGSILVPKKEGDVVYLVCPRCGAKYDSSGSLVVTDTVTKKSSDELEIIDEKSQRGAIVEATCPKCGNNKAYFTMVQTRASDEPPTRFYKCTKCGYVWREYD